MSLEGTERFSIGEVARMFRVSVSTLRHYEKIGLLAPEYVDPATGYRSYSTRQFECLNTIRYLRALEMPLEQIRDFLQDREVGKIQGMLLQQRQAVIQKRQALGIVQRKIENRLRQIQDALEGPLEEVRLVELPARRVAWLRDELAPKTYLDLEHSIRRLEAPAQEAVAFLGKVGVGLSLQRLWQGNYFSYDRVFLLLDREDRYPGPVETLLPATWATLRFRGSHRQAGEHYVRLLGECRERGLSPVGTAMEITMIDDGMTSDPEQFVTEIQIPVGMRQEKGEEQGKKKKFEKSEK